MNSNRMMWGLVSVVVLLTIAVASGSFVAPGQSAEDDMNLIEPTPELTDTRDLSKYGMVEYDKAGRETYDSRRVQISRRYDNQQWVFKSVLPGTGGVGRVKEDEPPPLIPTDESTAVVIGGVEKVQTFLSNDKKGIYTEFSIKVEETLKKDSRAKVAKRIITDREGGVVVYPGGQRIKYENSNQELLAQGSKYLLFLATDTISPNYLILTSYELTPNGFRQLESGRSLGEFKGTKKEDFLRVVRQKLSTR